MKVLKEIFQRTSTFIITKFYLFFHEFIHFILFHLNKLVICCIKNYQFFFVFFIKLSSLQNSKFIQNMKVANKYALDLVCFLKERKNHNI